MAPHTDSQTVASQGPGMYMNINVGLNLGYRVCVKDAKTFRLLLLLSETYYLCCYRRKETKTNASIIEL